MTSLIIPLLFVLLNVESAEKKNENGFLDEIKNIFHSFWRAIIWWKNKKLIKNSGSKL